MSARTMSARFASVCSCGETIAAGEPIRYVHGMRATHERCGDPTESVAARRPKYASRSRYVSSRCSHEDYPCCGCER